MSGISSILFVVNRNLWSVFNYFNQNQIIHSRSLTETPKILISHSEIPIHSLNILQDKYELVFSSGLPYPRKEQILKDVKGVVGILWWSKERVDRELVDTAGPQLKVVGCMSAGYNHIDVPLLKSRGIKVSTTPGILNSAVAEIAIGLLLATSRRILEGYNSIISDKWEPLRPMWMCGFGLDNSTVGIVGLGEIGLSIAKRIQPFGISRILYSGRTEKEEGKALGAEFVTLHSLAEQSDFVIIACALTADTRHLIDKQVFAKMKPNCVLVNISRGDVINQDDLVMALKEGLIRGAGLDVMTPEPLPHVHPLAKMSNVVLTPHIGSATVETREEMASLAAKNIYNALNDLPMITQL